MWQIIALFLVVALISAALNGIGVALYFVFFYVVLPIMGISILYIVIRGIYHALNPEAKRAYLERKANEAKKNRKKKAQEGAEVNAKMEREKAENRRKEFERQQHRDGDQQATPYTYQIGKHGNESLAIRYGIANQERKVKEYWYHAQGGEQKRNPDRDKVFYEPAGTIRLQKTRKVGEDLFEVLLTDFRDRKARAIIEVGTEYVKTFYPPNDSWFEKHADLEEALKGNNSFTLKELATFHVQKAVGT